MKRDSEQALIEWLVIGAQMGDSKALEQLVVKLYPKLMRFSERQLQDAEGAKDVVHNTLELLNRNLGTLKDPATFPTSVYQILYRKGVDFIRGNQRYRQYHQDLDIEQAEVYFEETPQFIRFEKFLTQLDSGHYHVVHLHYLEGLNIQEVAAVLNLPEGTVKSRLFKARQLLKNSMNGEKV